MNRVQEIRKERNITPVSYTHLQSGDIGKD